jgi:hypothetical protein
MNKFETIVAAMMRKGSDPKHNALADILNKKLGMLTR